MSYNRTVYCQSCYQSGHNRRTCPQLTKSYRSRAQAEVDEGRGKEGYWHKEYAKRTGCWIGGELATEFKATRSGSKRRCKYCAKTGHNTRTCVELKDAKSDVLTNTKAIRTKIAAALENRGLGIGALITQNKHGSGSKKVGYMVTGFQLSYVNSESINHNPDVIQVTALNPSEVSSYRRVTSIPLPPIEGVNENSWSQNTELVGPVNSAAVVLPDGWIEDESFLDAMFRERKSPNHYDNQYED